MVQVAPDGSIIEAPPGAGPDHQVPNEASAAPLADHPEEEGEAAWPADTQTDPEQDEPLLPFIWEEGMDSWVSGAQSSWSRTRLRDFLELAPLAETARPVVLILGKTHVLARHQFRRVLWPEAKTSRKIKAKFDRMQEIGIVSRLHWGHDGLDCTASHVFPVYVLGPSGRQILQLLQASSKYRGGLVRHLPSAFRCLCANEIWSWLARDEDKRLAGWETAYEVAAGGETALVAAKFLWKARGITYRFLVDVLRGDQDLEQVTWRVAHLNRYVAELEATRVPSKQGTPEQTILWLVAETEERAVYAEQLLHAKGMALGAEGVVPRMWSTDAGLFSRRSPDKSLFAVYPGKGGGLQPEAIRLPGFDPKVEPAFGDKG